MFWSPEEKWALMLSTFAGLSTTVGGLLAVVGRPEEKQLALLLGIAIGVMFTLSFVELWLRNAAEVGWISITTAVSIGASVYHFMQPFLPDFRYENASSLHSDNIDSETNKDKISTEGKIVEDKPAEIRRTGTIATRRRSAELLRLGFLMAFTMTLHNFPEGFAVAFASFTDFGPVMAAAIAVHNIPEGIIVAAPVYAATSSRMKALVVATLSGLSEPLGALLALMIAKPFKLMTGNSLPLVLAFVGGIMSAVCVLELWPEGKKCKEDKHLFLGIFIGSVLMLSTLMAGV